MAKAKKWADGKELYSKGLAALGVERKEGEANGEAEDRKEVEIEEACYINRALCNLELSMFLENRPVTYFLTTSIRRKLPLHNPRLRLYPPPQPR